jgi:tRNA threonylcarbamoyladenosine biosynthesis protein TsaB
MTILGVDTATAVSSVALLEDGQVSAEAAIFPPQSPDGVTVSSKSNHSETVLPLIQSVLETRHRRFSDIDAIAVSIGPGSFTGLRIGLALVKGLAYECNLPVVGVSSLEAQAARVTESVGAICPLLDARKQEVYAALFDRRDEKLVRCRADQAIEVSELIGLFGAITDTAAIAFVGNGAARYREQIVDLFGERAQIIGENCGGSAAGALARLALARLTEASGADLGQLVPLYLGASQALGNTRRILPNPLK